MLENPDLPEQYLFLGVALITDNLDLGLCCHFRVNSIINIKKRIARKLRIVILLHLGLVFFKLHFGRNSKIGFYLGILEPWKDRGRKIPTIRPIDSSESWIWDQQLPENMKRRFGNMGSIFSNKH